jgi:hypothetical protein
MTGIFLAGAAALAIFSGPETGHTSHVMAMCPMSVPGTQVRSDDVDGGESITFTTTGSVSDLRERVKTMAGLHNDHHGDADARAPTTGGGMMGSGNAMNGATVPPSRATVVEVEGGAAIVVVPSVPGDLEVLRTAIRAQAGRLQRNGCDMMGQTRNE